MDTLESIISQVIMLKNGNKDFALFSDADAEWEAWIGNPNPVVRLGETEGEYKGYGDTAMNAVIDLHKKLMAIAINRIFSDPLVTNGGE